MYIQNKIDGTAYYASTSAYIATDMWYTHIHTDTQTHSHIATHIICSYNSTMTLGNDVYNRNR